MTKRHAPKPSKAAKGRPRKVSTHHPAPTTTPDPAQEDPLAEIRAKAEAKKLEHPRRRFSSDEDRIAFVQDE